MSVRIVTDSTADLTREAIRDYHIVFVPLNVRFGAETFKDRVELSSADFFERLEKAEALPTTSLPSPADFQAVYADLTSGGAEVVSLHLSSQLSGTFQSARAAAAEFGRKVHVVDTGHVSGSLFLLVIGAARMAAAGASSQDILQWITDARARVRIYFIVDTLEYLQRSGRIGRAGHLIGSLLDLKPILTLRDGVIEACAKVRSRRKACARVAELLADNSGVYKDLAMAFTRTCEECDAFARLLQEQFPQAAFHESRIGPVVGANAGPGAIAVAAL